VNHDEIVEGGLSGAAVAGPQGLTAEVRLNLLRQAVRQQPGSWELLYQLSGALADAGKDNESAKVFREAYLIKPQVRPVLEKRPEAFPGENARRLRDRASSLIANGAVFAPVIGALARAEALLGGEAEVRRLVDFDRFFRCYSMPAPNGQPSAAFNGELAAEVRSNLKFYDAPTDRAIRKAWRNNTLFSEKFPLAWSLSIALREEVKRYMSDLPSEPGHPFLASRPAEFVIEGWGVVSSHDSHHKMHIHENAWASGVYYVVRPPTSRDKGSRRGWLKVGPPDDVPEGGAWESRSIEPEPGNLVLMPGYFYHGTRPMGVDEERICIAFDVVPAELAARPS
jgi:Putative 2OG-Fe(II) oxygenase